MTKTQTVGGVCAGVGGLEMAAELALGPIETAWHAENDSDASAVLAARRPGVPNHGDLTAIDWRKVEPVDLLCAGFPCQTVSAAGKQRGDADKRWLWERPAPDPAGETAGVIAAVRILRPPTVVIENVANLVSIQGGRLFRTVLDDLRAAGYAVRWAIAGACTALGCHHRHRVFILARRVGRIAPPAIRVPMPTCINNAPHLLPAPRARDWKRGGKDGLEEALLPTPRSSDDRRGSEPLADGRTVRGHGGSLHDAIALLPTPRASDTGTPGRRAGEGFRPPLSQVILQLLPIPRATGGTKGCANMRGSSGDLMLPSAVQPERWGQYAAAVALWADVFGAPPPEPTEPNTRGGLRLDPRFPEWMMGLSAGWVTDLCSRNASLRLIGNGVMPQHGGRVLGLLAADEEAPTDLFGALAVAR